MNDELFTVAEVATRLKVNPQTVRNWIDRGELTEIRVGSRRVRITQAELNRFLKLKEQAAESRTPRSTSNRRRNRATVADMEVVEDLIENMLKTAARLPQASVVRRELAESAGRLQVALRVPTRDGSSQAMSGSDERPSTSEE